MKKKARASVVSVFEEIFESIEKDLRSDLEKEDGDYLASVPADGSATRNHMADSNTPNYAAKGLAVLTKENLRRVADAKKRLRNGTFGICIDPDCDATIEDERLFKNPFIERCLPCQKAFEKEEARKKRLMGCRGTLPGKH
ncbi:MAG TPA: TraR/DksA C4-type zinc finger protein [Patescibacteria group bacterium]